jgi:cell fate (sporulation/competence/biofilm development) regulator YlbF (YheA/YmcA/DUF963 family)
MGNRIEVLFEVDSDGAGKRELKAFADSMTDLQEAALSTGVPIDALINKVRGMSTAQIDAVTAGLRNVKKEAAEAAAQMERVQRGGSPVGPQPASTQTGQLATRSLLGRFDRAAQEIKELDKETRNGGRGFKELAAGAEEATGRVSRLRGAAAELKQALKGAAGRNGLFGDVVDIGGAVAGGAASGLAIAGIAAIGSYAAQKFEEMRQKAEAEFHALEVIINKGLVGSTKEAGSRLQEFEDLRQDIRIREATGESVSDKEIEKRTQGQAANRAQLDLLTKTVRERNRKFEITAEQLGETNIFEHAKGRLSSLKNDVVSTEHLNKELERLESNFKRDGDIVAFNKGLEGTEKWAKAVTEQFKKVNEELDKQAQRGKLQEGADIAIKQLSRQLSSNDPLALFFDNNEIRIDQFRKQFGSLGDDIVKKYTEVSRKLTDLDLFKAQFDTFNKITSFQSQLDESRNGGGARRAELDSIQARRDEIESEIYKRRQDGTLDVGTHRKLLTEYDDLGGRRFASPAPDKRVQQSVDFGQNLLGQADREGNAAKQQTALDFILSATGNVSKLDDSQLKARNEALERRLKIEQENLQKQQQAAQTIRDAADVFKSSANSLNEQVKAGINVDVKITDSPSTNSQLSEQPSPFSGSFGNSLSNNY